jgi:hypothetical protein
MGVRKRRGIGTGNRGDRNKKQRGLEQETEEY